jgi:hypothetical protein
MLLANGRSGDSSLDIFLFAIAMPSLLIHMQFLSSCKQATWSIGLRGETSEAFS